MSWNLDLLRCSTPSSATFRLKRWPGHMTSDSANHEFSMSDAMLRGRAAAAEATSAATSARRVVAARASADERRRRERGGARRRGIDVATAATRQARGGAESLAWRQRCRRESVGDAAGAKCAFTGRVQAARRSSDELLG